MRILLDENKRFYKANLHCHTTNSDGSATPERIKEEYKKRGYSVVAFTDHEHIIDNSHLTDESFLAINGCEVAIKEDPTASTMTSPMLRVTHLNFYATEPDNLTTPCYNSVADHFCKNIDPKVIRHDGEYTRTYSREGITEMINLGHVLGFMVAYNHPGWSLETAADYLGYEGLDFVEIRNHSCFTMGHSEDEHAYEDMLRAGKRVWCTAADDNHNRADFDAPDSDSFGGFVMINADRLDYRTIISALKNGDFYASGAPEIYSLTLDGDEVHVRCSPAKRVVMISRGRARITVTAPDGEFLTDVRVKLRADFDGFRVKVTDEHNLSAWSQFYEMGE